MILNNKEYKTILLDTNAVRELLFSNDGIGIDESKKESFKNYMNSFMIEEPHIILISIMTLYELSPHIDIYSRFLALFEYIPFCIVFSESFIIKEEYKGYLNKEIIKLDNNNNILYAISYFKDNLVEFDNEVIKKLISELNKNNYLNDLEETTIIWENQRIFSQTQTLKYSKEIELETINKNLDNYNYHKIQSSKDLKYFSGLRLIEFCHFNKIHRTEKAITKNDVIDIKICSIVPYVDVVITENQQAEFFKQAKGRIPLMKNVDILRLKDIKFHKKSNK